MRERKRKEEKPNQVQLSKEVSEKEEFEISSAKKNQGTEHSKQGKI